jgi:hypothetical protein
MKEDEWIFSIFDFFDIRFWSPADCWFTGFHPDDRRKLRPIGLQVLFLPVLVAGDYFCIIGWVWNYTLRSNITITLLPFLEEYYEAPNEALCLPAPLRLPDPAYGCAPPTFEFAPPILDPDLYPEFFILEFCNVPPLFLCIPLCRPYRNPFKNVLIIIQGILTTFLGSLLPENPFIGVIENILNWISLNIFQFEFDFILINGDFDEYSWICIFPQFFLLLVVAVFLIVIGLVILDSCYKNFRDIFRTSGNESNENKVKDLSHEMQQLYEMVKISLLAIVYNNQKIKKCKCE